MAAGNTTKEDARIMHVRAQGARAALAAYAEATEGSPPGEGVDPGLALDCLTDILHVADEEAWEGDNSAERLHERALAYYRKEKTR